MAASSRLKLSDIVAALDSLTIEQTKELVVRFGVEFKTVQDIEHEHKGSSSRKLHSIQTWLDQDTQASWKKLVSGLQQMKMNNLAKQVAEQHCLQSSPGAATVDGGGWARVQSYPPLTPPPSSSPPSTDPNQPPFPPPSHRCQPVAVIPPPFSHHPSTHSFWSLEKVKATIQELEDRFSGLIRDTDDEIAEKESSDGRFLKKFCTRILSLSVSRKATHVQFFRESEDEIRAAPKTSKYFTILCRHIDYRNYEILRDIVLKFCGPPLQSNMKEYCKMLEVFETSTTVDVYVNAVPDEVTEDKKKAFSEMVVKIDKPASQCTLHDVRKLNEANSGLCPHSVYISGVANKCVEVVVRFPSSAAGWVLAALTPHFMTTHHLTEVTLDGSRLPPLLEDTRENLNKELISASKSGDVMRVTSLLNSGADIETLGSQGGWTPLISAAEGGHCDVVIELLSLGANINSQMNYGQSALMKAAFLGNTDVVVELVKRGANLDLQNKTGESALMRAVYLGNTDVVVELVKRGANLDLQNKNGDSAVIRAVHRYRPDTLRELVGAGSNLNLQNKEGLTALMIAARSGRTDLTNILLEGKHIDPDIQENGTGWSALHFSAERGDWDTTRGLLEAGASPHLKDKNGLTAMEIAEVKAEEGEEGRPYNEYKEKRPEYNYEGVISLLRKYCAEEPTTTPSHHDSSTVHQDTPPTQQDILDTTQIPSTRQRRGRRNISQALRNLVNKSGQIALQIFNDLDRRLKSADKKDQSGVKGQGSEGKGQGRKGKLKIDNRKRHQTSQITATTVI